MSLGDLLRAKLDKQKPANLNDQIASLRLFLQSCIDRTAGWEVKHVQVDEARWSFILKKVFAEIYVEKNGDEVVVYNRYSEYRGVLSIKWDEPANMQAALQGLGPLMEGADSWVYKGERPEDIECFVPCEDSDL